jgi:hypothetical protein
LGLQQEHDGHKAARRLGLNAKPESDRVRSVVRLEIVWTFQPKDAIEIGQILEPALATHTDMLLSLKIENFRRFRLLEFPKLKRVNLITGKNNSGKTGVLESLFMLLEPKNIPDGLPSAFRSCQDAGNASENYWQWLFHNHHTSAPIRVTVNTNQFDGYSIAISCGQAPSGSNPFAAWNGFNVSMPPIVDKQTHIGYGAIPLPYGAVPLSIHPTNPQKDALDYDRVVLKAGGEERLEALLREVEPRLKSIRSIKPHGASLLYVDIGLKEKIPAIHFGQGFIRLLSIYSEIIASGKKVILIDEFENGLHYSVLVDIWRGILKATEQEGVQVFATTHSYECIRAAHAAFAETFDYDFALHRLDEVNEEITVTTYDKETLETSFERHFEIR